MSVPWRDRILTGVLILGLTSLFACGGGGGGTPLVLPDDEPPGNGEPPPGNGQPPAPLLPADDAYAWTGNTRLTVAAAAGLLGNDPPGTVIAAADAATTLGGAVAVNTATGAFTYDPPVELQNAADTFHYTVAGFDPLTVTIELDERIWYVDNTRPAGGDGTLLNPFNTLAAAELASDADDTIFVFTGTPLAPTDAGQNLGITLAAGQKLLGQGLGLRFNGVPIVDSLPNAPVISNAGLAPAGANIPVVELDATTGGNEVAGFTIQADFNEGILALGGAGHNLHDNRFTFPRAPDQGREGIRLLNVTGANLVAGNTITGSGRDGIRVANNENLVGDLVAPTPVSATVTLSRNVIADSVRDGIAVILDGAGTDVTLNILVNTIDNSGNEAGRQDEGIHIDSLGAARVTAFVSRNTVSGSAGEGIDQGAAGTSAIAAFVANNDLSLNGPVADFRGRILAAGAAFCLELINNVNGLGDASFRVDNDGGTAGAFEYFEPPAADPQANDRLADQNPLNRPDLFTLVAQGACAVPLDGAALFEANCSICHTGNGMGLETPKLLIARDITGRTAAQITEQFTVNGSMALIFLDNVRFKLTPQEVEAIAAALAVAP